MSQENPLYPNNRPIRAEDDMDVDDEPATASPQTPITPPSNVVRTPSSNPSEGVYGIYNTPKVYSDEDGDDGSGGSSSNGGNSAQPRGYSNTPVITDPKGNYSNSPIITKKPGEEDDDEDGDEGELPATPGSNQSGRPPGNPDFDHNKQLPITPGKKISDEEDDAEDEGELPSTPDLQRTNPYGSLPPEPKYGNLPPAKDPDYDKMPVKPNRGGEDSDEEEEEEEDGGESSNE